MAKDYDAIVIGSGLGGLTAGALYARAGHRVLVLEQNDRFGGKQAFLNSNGFLERIPSLIRRDSH